MSKDLIPHLSKYLDKLIVQPDEDAISNYFGERLVTDIYTEHDTLDLTTYLRADREQSPSTLNEKEDNIPSLEEALHSADHIDEPLRTIIFAPPGYGKSLLLKMKARKLAKAALDSLQKPGYVSTDLSIPIRLSVSSFAGKVPHSGENPDAVLKRAIREQLLWEYPHIDDILAAYLAENAHEQQMWLLLDDFHDWFINHQGRDWVLDGMLRWKSHVVIVSRPQGFSDKPLPLPFRINVLNGFLSPQVHTFLQRWWSTNRNMYEMVLNYTSNTQAGRQLSRNPLFLTLLCGYFQKNRVPEDITSAVLYDSLLEHLLGRVNNDNGMVDVKRAEEWLEVLPALVYRFMKDNYGTKEIPVKYLLHALSNLNIAPVEAASDYSSKGSELLKELCSKGVLFPLGADRASYIFPHSSIMEYLVARGITEIIDNNDNDEHANEIERINLSRAAWRSDWQQVFVFLATMLSKSLLLIRMLINKEDDDFYRCRLILALQCLAEVPSLTGSLNDYEVSNIGDELISTLCNLVPTHSYLSLHPYARRWREIINDNIANVIKPKLTHLLTCGSYEERLRAAVVIISVFTEELIKDSVWKQLLKFITENKADLLERGTDALLFSTNGINRYIADKSAISKKLVSLININDFKDNVFVINMFRLLCEPTKLLDALISLTDCTREYTKRHNLDYHNRPPTSLQDELIRSPLVWNTISEHIINLSNMLYINIMKKNKNVCISDKYVLHLKTIAAGSNHIFREEAENIIKYNITFPQVTEQVTPTNSLACYCDPEYSLLNLFYDEIMYDNDGYNENILDALLPRELEACKCIIPVYLNFLLAKPLSPAEDLHQIINMSYNNNAQIRKIIALQLGPLQSLRYILLHKDSASVLQKNINSQQTVSRVSELLDDKCISVRIAAAASYRYHSKRSCNGDNIQDKSHLVKCDKIYDGSVEWVQDQLHTGSPFDKLCAIVIIGEANETVIKNNEIVSSLICISRKRFAKEEENRYLAQIASQILRRYGRMGLRIFPVGALSDNKWCVKSISELTSTGVERDNNLKQQKRMLHKYVKPSNMEAYLSFLYVCWREGGDPLKYEDEKAYQYLKRNGIIFEENDYEEYEKYLRKTKFKKMWEHIKAILPKIEKYSVEKIEIDSWKRYLGKIRNIFEMQKHTPRAGRTGRSIVNEKDL